MTAPRTHTAADTGKERGARTLAQTTCLVLGATLVAVGVLGFIFGGTNFNTGDNVDGRDFIIFEVNGWHNVVHILTGGLLLLGAPKPATAVTSLLIFGGGYALVTIWGFVDGNDVFNLIPVDFADNILHVALTALALFVAFSAGGLAAAGRRERRAGPAR
jgi:FtsH-binding integral membrane protein